MHASHVFAPTNCDKSQTMNGGMNAALLECGLVSGSFGRHAARKVFETILHRPFDTLHICYEGSRRCFFLPPSVLGYTHMPICLDFRHDLSSSIIPQHFWQPISNKSCGRYVTGATLEKPIFFDHLSGGGFGLTVEEACNGLGAHLRRWNEVVELGGKATMQLRLWVALSYSGRTWSRLDSSHFLVLPASRRSMAATD